MTEQANTGVVPGINFDSLLGKPESNPQPASPLESALATVTPDDAAASTPDTATFSFRTLLSQTQRSQLTASAPAAAEKMMADYGAIIGFGEPVLTKLSAMSTELLNAQRDINIPEAEQIVNDLLRDMDGFERKYRNQKIENAANTIANWWRTMKYSLKALVRESKPIVEKIDLAELKLKEMELKLADNVTRGQQLHKNATATLEDVVAVLAALEEIVEVARKEFAEADSVLTGAGEAASVTYKGREITVNELREIHAQMSGGISEMEKSWFDWRQQFFLGYAQAPSVRNLILVSATMQRRCQVFRTMGLPSARSSLALWQQAMLAKEGAEMGEAVAEGTNKLIQGAFGATADAVTQVAKASQTPVISEETVFAIIDSVRKQCEGLVAADQWGRELRGRNIKALEAGEKQIDADFTKSRSDLVRNAVAGTSATAIEAAPLPEADILGQLGVQA